MGIDRSSYREDLSGTKKLIAEMLLENRQEYIQLIKKVKEESGVGAAAFLEMARGEMAKAVKQTQVLIQADATKVKILEAQVAALTREVESLKKDSASGVDIAALKRRLDALEKKKA